MESLKNHSLKKRTTNFLFFDSRRHAVLHSLCACGVAIKHLCGLRSPPEKARPARRHPFRNVCSPRRTSRPAARLSRSSFLFLYSLSGARLLKWFCLGAGGSGQTLSHQSERKPRDTAAGRARLSPAPISQVTNLGFGRASKKPESPGSPG